MCDRDFSQFWTVLRKGPMNRDADMLCGDNSSFMSNFQFVMAILYDVHGNVLLQT